MKQRRLKLILADSMIILSVYLCMALLVNLQFDSIRVMGAFSVGKFLLLYGCIMGSRIALKVYRTVWRYANVTTYLILVVADLVSGTVFVLLGRIFPLINLGFAVSVVSMMGIIIITLCSRFVYQSTYVRMHLHQESLTEENRLHKVNVAIVGAGNVGAALAEELLHNPKAHYLPYCFIDKDVQKIGQGINGLPIYPESDQIVERLKEMPVQEIVITLPNVSAEEKTRLYNLYKQTGCKVKLYDYPLSDGGRVTDGTSRRTLREFRIEDLLFRDSHVVANKKAQAYYKDKTVLVTGGGGSIGSELCRQIASVHPRRLVIFDIYENNAYDIQQELLWKYGDTLKLNVLIGSVRDEKRLDEVFSTYHPDVVFHAAAHKHVPLMEFSGGEAVKNNVMGTYNTANMAEKYGVQKFVLISTDKAVNPTNVMGASKRMCEMVIQCRKDSPTAFTAVRFGNVLGSNGSVIPLFKNQIAAGGPITLTDKRIVRYFMTIPEAVALVMETGAIAGKGELYVLDMGRPVKILDLAENMIRMSGLRPYEDIDIQEVGLRPGEKLYEELLMKTEELEKTENELIFVERDKPLSRPEVEKKLLILREAVEKQNAKQLHEAFCLAVPTYHTPEEVNRNASEAEEMKKAMTRESA